MPNLHLRTNDFKQFSRSGGWLRYIVKISQCYQYLSSVKDKQWFWTSPGKLGVALLRNAHAKAEHGILIF